MLNLVAVLRLVTSRQFSLCVAGDRNERAFAQRLQFLAEEEMLVRPRHQRRPGTPAKHYAYALGIAGHKVLYPEQWKGPNAKPPRDWRQRDRRIQIRAIEHEVALAEVLLTLRVAAEAQGWSCNWSMADEFRARTDFPRNVEIRFDYGEPLSIPLNPDAFVTLDTGEGRVHFFVEVDMATEPHERRDLRRSSIRQKLLAYWQLNHDRLRHFDKRRDSFRVLLVTTTEERMQNMREAAQQADPKRKGSHFFLFTTHGRCRLENPDALLTDRVWWTARAGYDNPRTLFLPPCARCQQLLDPANEPHEIANSDMRLVLAPASTPLPDLLPDDDPTYAHVDCPGLRGNG